MYETLKRQNIHSLMVVPLYDDGRTGAFLVPAAASCHPAALRTGWRITVRRFSGGVLRGSER